MECFYCNSKIELSYDEAWLLDEDGPVMIVKAKSRERRRTITLAAHTTCYERRPHPEHTLTSEVIEALDAKG